MKLKLISGIFLLMSFAWVSPAQLTMKKREGGILIVDGKENVLMYQTAPKSKDGRFSRSNYIHPLYGLNGQILTEDFPADHLHHRGVFWAWHQVWIGDKQIGDPWELVDFEQDVVELEFMKGASESVEIRTEVDWKSRQWRLDGRIVPYLKEHAKITVHPSTGTYRKIDFEISLLALVDDLKIGGSNDAKGYSGFSVRMKLPDDVKFSGKNGEVVPEVTAVKSDGFVNVSGTIGQFKGKGGIVIVDNPGNPGYPQSWILRDKNSMQNAVYPGNKLVPLSTTEPLVLKYSLLVYTGKMSSNKIEKIIQREY
ncbi:PmoA family protein [uncultured Draconibacterium sp.]|uniref:DUF6807 domain-containing protein n=1 Tax=uncultured Draconibacterium sp. TaxID=1573823 RepID=UPI0032176A8A